MGNTVVVMLTCGFLGMEVTPKKLLVVVGL